MKAILFVPLILAGCSHVEQENRIRDLKIDKHEEINQELIKAIELNRKIMDHILTRLKDLENRKELSFPEEKKEWGI